MSKRKPSDIFHFFDVRMVDEPGAELNYWMMMWNRAVMNGNRHEVGEISRRILNLERKRPQ